MSRAQPYAVSIAPMMDRSDRHFRVFMRQLTRSALVYTEMLTTGAIIHGDRHRLLGFSEVEHPIAIQIGGDDPVAMAESARIAEDFGYDEVNINVGCPSERVQKGSFGACLMLSPDRVARCVEAMRRAVSVPVTVKHRIGVDDRDAYEDMASFVDVVKAAGADRFTVHARKAWLSGLSPKENREIPPLRYDDVYRLKREHPQSIIEVNGGVRDLDAVARHLEEVDGVMIGRAAYEDPFVLAEVDQRFFGSPKRAPTRREVLEGMIEHAELHRASGGKLVSVIRHVLTLYKGRPGGRVMRRILTEGAKREDLHAIWAAIDAIDRIEAQRIASARLEAVGFA